LTIVEFAFDYDFLNHLNIIGLTGLIVKGYRLLAVR